MRPTRRRARSSWRNWRTSTARPTTSTSHSWRWPTPDTRGSGAWPTCPLSSTSDAASPASTGETYIPKPTSWNGWERTDSDNPSWTCSCTLCSPSSSPSSSTLPSFSSASKRRRRPSWRTKSNLNGLNIGVFEKSRYVYVCEKERDTTGNVGVDDDFLDKREQLNSRCRFWNV